MKLANLISADERTTLRRAVHGPDCIKCGRSIRLSEQPHGWLCRRWNAVAGWVGCETESKGTPERLAELVAAVQGA